MANMVRSSIAKEVKECGEFSIMADESKDCRKMEQISVVLRYFRKGTVYESFVGFIQVTDLSAEGLSSALILQMTKLGLDYKAKLIGQGYDGASVMSGKHSGVAALIKDDAQFALYIHCHAHRLNLALVDCVKAIPQAAEFFALLELLYVFVSGSFVHARWVEIQKQLYPAKPIRELQRLSDTRWACRYAACRAVLDRLSAVVQLLSELEAGANAKRAVEARSLLIAVDSRFVLMLTFMCDIFGRTQSLSLMLQSSSIDFDAAIVLLECIRADLVSMRSAEEHLNSLWVDALSSCERCGIEVELSDVTESLAASRPTRKRRLPAHLQDSCVTDTVGERPEVHSKLGFKTNVYFPVLDRMLNELERRFASTNCDVLKGIQALSPSSQTFADITSVSAFAQAYGADVEDLSHELHQAKRLLQRMTIEDRPNTLVEFISHIERYGDAFAELHRLGVIAISLPVSTASCERSFSALRHIKTWVRNSISNDKLDSVSVLAIECERTQALDNGEIVDLFAAAHNNRRIALI